MAVISRNGRPAVATQDDVLQASKAVHDRLDFSIKEQMAGIEHGLSTRFAKQVDRLDKTVEGEMETLKKYLRKELEEEYERRLEGEQAKRLRGELAKGLEDADRRYTEALALQEVRHAERLQEVKTFYQDRLEIFTKDQREHGERLEQVKALYQGRMDAFQQGHEEMLAEIRDVLKALPIPIVNMTVPEQRPPDIHLTVPEQKSADIIVNVPRQEVPIVNVQASKPRLISKTIQYDDMGRPQTIVEKEV